MAKVTGSDAPVRIDAQNPHGGWDAKNLVTGRKVRIKTAGRLKRQCTQADLANIKRPTPKRRSKTATVANTSPTAARVAKTPVTASEKATVTKGRDTSQTGKQHQRPTGAGHGSGAEAPIARRGSRLSGLTAAFMVLVDANTELGVKKIVELAAEKGWWKSDAATPHATIYASIIREITNKGDKARFRRGKSRGTFRAVFTPEQKTELFGKQA